VTILPLCPHKEENLYSLQLLSLHYIVEESKLSIVPACRHPTLYVLFDPCNAEVCACFCGKGESDALYPVSSIAW